MVGLKYLLYEAETNLDDSHLTQAFLTGEYSSLDLIIANLEAFLGLCFEVWTSVADNFGLSRAWR